MKKSKPVKTKPIEHICDNCQLFSPAESSCSVRVLVQGKIIRDIPVDANDSCFWEANQLADEIKQVRFWVENESGEKTNGNGKVKIEYPEDLL